MGHLDFGSLMDKEENKEAFYIARFNPDLNKQVQSFHLTPYPMGTGIT